MIYRQGDVIGRTSAHDGESEGGWWSQFGVIF